MHLRFGLRLRLAGTAGVIGISVGVGVSLGAYEVIEHGLACLELFVGGLGPRGLVSTFWGAEGFVTCAHLVVELLAGILFFRFSGFNGSCGSARSFFSRGSTSRDGNNGRSGLLRLLILILGTFFSGERVRRIGQDISIAYRRNTGGKALL